MTSNLPETNQPTCWSLIARLSAEIKSAEIKTARSFIVKLQAVGIDAVHVCEASGFFGLGLGWPRRLLLLRLAGFVRVLFSTVGHDWSAFLKSVDLECFAHTNVDDRMPF